MDVVGQLANVVVLGAAGFVRQVKKSNCVGKLLSKERYPPISVAPRTGSIVESFSRTVKCSRNDLVADAQTRSFIALRFREISAVKAAERGMYGLDVVTVDQLDAVTMCKAVVLRIQIASLVESRLQTLVVDHRLHAVLIRQGEIKQLQLDGDRLFPAICVYRDCSGIETGGQISIGVDFEPNRLVLISSHTKWKPTQTGACILGNQLYRFPSSRVLWRCGRTNFVDPFRVRRNFYIHVVDGKNLNGPAVVIRRIQSGRGVVNFRLAALLC